MVVLALPASAFAVITPIPIGPGDTGEANQAAVAVDSSGTAYIAWEAPSLPPRLDFCKVHAERDRLHAGGAAGHTWWDVL